jgi:hypothetical protein
MQTLLRFRRYRTVMAEMDLERRREASAARCRHGFRA